MGYVVILIAFKIKNFFSKVKRRDNTFCPGCCSACSGKKRQA